MKHGEYCVHRHLKTPWTLHCYVLIFSARWTSVNFCLYFIHSLFVVIVIRRRFLRDEEESGCIKFFDRIQWGAPYRSHRLRYGGWWYDAVSARWCRRVVKSVRPIGCLYLTDHLHGLNRKEDPPNQTESGSKDPKDKGPGMTGTMQLRVSGRSDGVYHKDTEGNRSWIEKQQQQQLEKIIHYITQRSPVLAILTIKERTSRESSSVSKSSLVILKWHTVFPEAINWFWTDTFGYTLGTSLLLATVTKYYAKWYGPFFETNLFQTWPEMEPL